MVCTYNGILFSLKNEGSPSIWDNMGEPWGLYVKWNKPVARRQILLNATCVRYLKSSVSKRLPHQSNSKLTISGVWRKAAHPPFGCNQSRNSAVRVGVKQTCKVDCVLCWFPLCAPLIWPWVRAIERGILLPGHGNTARYL